MMVFLSPSLMYAAALPFHVESSQQLLQIFLVPIQHQEIQNIHRWIDTIPGASRAGGWYHRMLWGHTPESLPLLEKLRTPLLPPNLKKLVWASHILLDAKTPAGVPLESLRIARKIIANELFKYSMKPVLQYALVSSVINLLYQLLVMDVDLRTALVDVTKRCVTSFGVTTSINFLISRITSYTYPSGLTLFRFFSQSVPWLFFTIDLILRTWQTGSFLEAFLSSQTLINLFTAASFLIPVYGPIISTIFLVVEIIANIMTKHSLEAKHKAFEEAVDKMLLEQAEIAVNGQIQE